MIAGAQGIAERRSFGIEAFAEAASPPGEPIPHFEFSTDDVHGPDQFDAWRHNFAPMLELTPEGETPSAFYGRQVIWDLGCLALASISTEGLNFASLPGHVRRDPLDHWMMTLFLDGGAETDAQEKSFQGGPGAVQVHPLGRQFVGHVSDSQMLMMFVPRDFCRELASSVGAAEFSTLDGGMGHLFADYVTGLARRLPSLSVTDIPGLAAATRAMILACVAPSADRMVEARTHIAGVLLERARQFINANLYDPQLNKEALCRKLGISRTRLYRLFEPTGGVMRYIQHRRLVDAHRALADPGDTRRILEIAEQRGFNDGAEFSRAFRREFGYSPSEVRSRGMGDLPAKPGSDLSEALPEDRLGILLRRLQG
ncbi:helix-turn-helix domain-containing protein [Aminobacter sp. HY435]|uniref:helix-turn-helix domain-containing protein n=1 Tax=Aminobacter sp. HY435 TaxID=2970917 RepID=UPI0022B95D25|nr:helix-turn-helix domain-containing protein [Aminobacter sp. HY435]